MHCLLGRNVYTVKQNDDGTYTLLRESVRPDETPMPVYENITLDDVKQLWLGFLQNYAKNKLQNIENYDVSIYKILHLLVKIIKNNIDLSTLTDTEKNIIDTFESLRNGTYSDSNSTKGFVDVFTTKYSIIQLLLDDFPSKSGDSIELVCKNGKLLKLYIRDLLEDKNTDVFAFQTGE